MQRNTQHANKLTIKVTGAILDRRSTMILVARDRVRLTSSYDLVLCYYSVHTNKQALERGEKKIAEIGSLLKAEGSR